MIANSNRALETETHFFSPAVIDVLVEQETRLRIDYRHVQSQDDQTRRLLGSAAALLDLVYVLAALVESAHRHGAMTLHDVVEMGDVISREAHALTGVNFSDVVRQDPSLTKVLSARATPSPETPIAELRTIVSGADAIVRTFPEKETAELAAAVEVPELGARIQVALDGLRRFIRRNDPWTDQRLKLVGPEYVAGNLSIDVAAQVLELAIPDAVAKLEECGYARLPEHIELTADERNRLYETLRKDRLARGGKPASSSAAVARDVIATQRIESVDARPWVEQSLM